MPRLLVHLPGTISFIETMDTCDIVARKFGAYVFPSSDQYIASQQKDLIPDVIVTTDRERFEGTKMLRDFRDSISGSHVLLLNSDGGYEDLRETYKIEIVSDSQFTEVLESALRDSYRRSVQRVCNDLVGDSPAMHDLKSQIGMYAGTGKPVMIYGEHGSGKELVAIAIHNASLHRNGPFVDAHLGGISESLYESELFGYIKGAFTGASDGSVGYFERAADGTLFLDEVGTLPARCQPKLLRSLESRTFKKVGSSVAENFNGRFVAATNADLAKMVDDGEFRADLFYRMTTHVIHVPSLRERKEDIPLLVNHFLKLDGVDLNIDPDVIDMLGEYDFPGNVRELRNLVDNFPLYASDGILSVDMISGYLRSKMAERRVQTKLDLDPLQEAISTLDLRSATVWAEKQVVEAALKGSDNLKVAAEQLGIDRKTLRKKMQIHGLEF